VADRQLSFTYAVATQAGSPAAHISRGTGARLAVQIPSPELRAKDLNSSTIPKHSPHSHSTTFAGEGRKTYTKLHIWQKHWHRTVADVSGREQGSGGSPGGTQPTP